MTAASILDAGARVAPGTVRAALRAVPVVPRALAAPQRPTAAYAVAPWQVAVLMTAAVHGHSYHARRLRETATALARSTAAGHVVAGLPEARARAMGAWERVMALPERDRLTVTLCVIRALLDDAPCDAAEALDRALTAAQGDTAPPTAAHRETAAEIAAEVMR